VRGIIFSVFAILIVGTTTAAEECADRPDGRMSVFISDLHLGVGHQQKGGDVLEDFHWSRALKRFLDRIDEIGRGRTDLVILGDMLELWQHPTEACAGSGPDWGCDLDEIGRIASAVATEHKDDLAEIGRFANRGENKVHLVPGNHDAALLLPSVAKTVLDKTAAADGHLVIDADGIWHSADCRVVAEHGHQMDEVNSFRDWPYDILDTSRRYLYRPWGELFVQDLYNATEATYPNIDNIVPDGDAVDYYANSLPIGGTIADIARFVFFNVAHASVRQKIALGATGEPEWDVPVARTLGHKLFAAALLPSDPWRTRVTSQAELRDALDTLARDGVKVPDERVRALCDQIERVRSSDAVATDGLENVRCNRTLGAYKVKKWLGEYRLVRGRLVTLRQTYSPISVYVYAHTHHARAESSVDVNASTRVAVFNSGAFQRLTDLPTLEQLGAEDNKTGLDVLKVPLTKLPRCYGAVIVEPGQDGTPEGRLRFWYMDETDQDGALLPEDDARCAMIRYARDRW